MERTKRDDLLSYISDAHKDAFGFRPRGNWDHYEAMTDEELEAEADYLSDQVCLTIDREAEEHRIAGERFEAHITKMMSDHNINRETAIRWDIEALGLDKESIDFYGLDWYGYHHGLKMGYFGTDGE